MARSSKQALWARRLAACERSGQGRRAWCAAHGVNVHTFDYWRYRLRQKASPPAAARSKSRALVPIVVKGAVPPAVTNAIVVELGLPSGVQVRVPISTDPRWLAQLVRELSAC